MSLLQLLQDKKPIGQEDWQEVTNIHAANFPNEGRDMQSLRRKFNALRNKKMGTGNPIIPPDVKMAKEIYIAIAQRADVGTEDSTFDLETSSFAPYGTTSTTTASTATAATYHDALLRPLR